MIKFWQVGHLGGQFKNFKQEGRFGDKQLEMPLQCIEFDINGLSSDDY